MSASEILDGPDEWPGMHIPIVPFLGEEIKIGRQIVRRGVVRNLKDVQRLFNYAISADAEAVALQPKAPFKGTRVNFEKYLDQWETANTRNWPFLEYDPDPLNGGRPPEREPPPVASQGIKELLNVATQEMSAVTGIYPSSLGAPAQETSGKAIVARQREGDTGTFVYIESFGRSIERIGQIIVDLIPHIYDNERIAARRRRRRQDEQDRHQQADDRSQRRRHRHGADERSHHRQLSGVGRDGTELFHKARRSARGHPDA